MGDYECRPALHHDIERKADSVFGCGVERGRGFIEDEQGGISRNSAGEGEQLTLPDAQTAAALAQASAIAAPPSTASAKPPYQRAHEAGRSRVIQSGAHSAAGAMVCVPKPPVPLRQARRLVLTYQKHEPGARPLQSRPVQAELHALTQ
mgnify:CR=1 FL=1